MAYACHLVNRLFSSAIRGKTPLEIWLEKVIQDYDSLRVFECPAYYHVKENKLDPRVIKGVFLGFKKGVKGNKIWDSKNKKFILSRDVTFDEASMVKPTNSQQVESHLTANRILQQVESDATSPSLERSVSFEVTPSVIQGDDQVAKQDVDSDEDQGQTMSNVQESIAVGRSRRNPRNPVGSLLT